MKTLFTALCIALSLYGQAQPDTSKPVFTFNEVDLPPATRHCQEMRYEFKNCFIQAIIQQVEQNFNYPQLQSTDTAISATLFISFIIEDDGSITHCKVEKSEVVNGTAHSKGQRLLLQKVEAEAIKAIQRSTFLAPAQVNHKAVRMKYITPLTLVPPHQN